jgi:hypothetical protein
MSMDGTSALAELPEKLRDWYGHSPTARRAYARLRADLSTVAGRATPKVSEFWERIAPLIDPSSRGGATERSADANTRRDEAPSSGRTAGDADL